MKFTRESCSVDDHRNAMEAAREQAAKATKRQKTSANAVREALEGLEKAVEGAKRDVVAGENVEERVSQLAKEVHALATDEKVSAGQREMQSAVAKLGKAIDKAFMSDISKVCREGKQFDKDTLQEVIAQHFFREGRFEEGDVFVRETGMEPERSLKSEFEEMHGIIDSIENRKVRPALDWAIQHREKLNLEGLPSELEFKLVRLEYIRRLKHEGKMAALQFARENFPQHGMGQMHEISKLMGCLLYENKLEVSPYKQIVLDDMWGDVRKCFLQEYCKTVGHSSVSPLRVVVNAGALALQALLKLTTIMSTAGLSDGDELPVEIPLGPQYVFHSIFTCPVSKEQCTAENPPMRLQCGHVLCKQSIQKLARGGARPFKCPYCPTECLEAKCQQIHF